MGLWGLRRMWPWDTECLVGTRGGGMGREALLGLSVLGGLLVEIVSQVCVIPPPAPSLENRSRRRCLWCTGDQSVSRRCFLVLAPVLAPVGAPAGGTRSDAGCAGLRGMKRGWGDLAVLPQPSSTASKGPASLLPLCASVAERRSGVAFLLLCGITNDASLAMVTPHQAPVRAQASGSRCGYKASACPGSDPFPSLKHPGKKGQGALCSPPDPCSICFSISLVPSATAVIQSNLNSQGETPGQDLQLCGEVLLCLGLEGRE